MDDDDGPQGYAEFSDDEEELKRQERQQKKEKKKTKKLKAGGFQTMGFSQEIIKGITKKGYSVPTPIQRKSIPIILQGRDVVAMARTGSGKTAAFLLPMFHRLREHAPIVGARAIILSPTRELAMQTMKFTADLARFSDLRACAIVGGDSMERQFDMLAHNPDIIVATPGRLLHHAEEADLSFKMVEYVVFDEADRLFEEGFERQLRLLLQRMPSSRQTLLFSATLPSMIVEFANAGLNNPALIRLDTDTKVSERLQASFFAVRAEEKIGALVYLLNDVIECESTLTIVFVATRHHVEWVVDVLKRVNIDSIAIYGTMDPGQRKDALSRFRSGNTPIMVTTDVAARGIDIPLLDNVINFDFPGTSKLYVHRVGRVARAGRSGSAYSFATGEELPYLIDLHLFLGKTLTSERPEHESPDVSVYGTLPKNKTDFYTELVREKCAHDPEVAKLRKSAQNAHKLYARTRAVASAESVRRAKEMPEPQVHPALHAHMESMEEQKDDFVAQLRNFRPPITVLELVSKNAKKKGGGKRQGAGSNIMLRDLDKSDVMQEKRRQHDRVIRKRALEQQAKKEEAEKVKRKPRATLETDEESIAKLNASEVISDDVDMEEGGAEPANASNAANANTATTAAPPSSKPRESKRKKRKRAREGGEERSGEGEEQAAKRQKVQEQESFYMAHHKTDYTERGLSIRDPSAPEDEFLTTARAVSMDIAPDDNSGILRRSSQVRRWDRKKKKFISAGAHMTPDEVSKVRHRTRNESGGLIDANKKEQLYEKWKRKAKKEIPLAGEQDSTVGAGPTDLSEWRRRRPRFMAALENQRAGGDEGKSELRSEEDIRRMRKEKERHQVRLKLKSRKKSTKEWVNPKLRRPKMGTRSKILIV